MEKILTAIKIKFLGKSGRRLVELPIPYVQKCEKVGEVLCDPIGTFTAADGLALLAVEGIEETFQEVERIYSDGPVETKSEVVQPKTVEPEYYDQTCLCGCGGRLIKKPNHKFSGIPKYLLGHGGFKKGIGPKKTAPSPLPPV